MNCRIQIRLFKDSFLKNIIFVAMSAVTVFITTIAVTGFSNYKNLANYFPDSFNNIYIYRFDSTLYDMNCGNGYGVATIGAGDYFEIIKERKELISETFDVNDITLSNDIIYLDYDPSGKMQPENMDFLQVYDYGYSVFKDISVDVVEGRLPKKEEVNVILLPSSYKSKYRCNQTYEFYLNNNINAYTESGKGVKVSLRVIGYFENPFLLDSSLNVKMNSYLGIAYLSEEVRAALSGSSNTLLIKTNSELSEDEIADFMKAIDEDPSNFFKYDPKYEYEGKDYNLKKNSDEVKNKVLLAIVVLFVMIMADTYIHLERIVGFVVTLIKIGFSRKTAILNILINKLIVIVPGLVAGTVIYKNQCDSSMRFIGGISISEYFWSTKYALFSLLLVLTVCLIAHIPFIVKVLSVELQREE